MVATLSKGGWASNSPIYPEHVILLPGGPPEDREQEESVWHTHLTMGLRVSHLLALQSISISLLETLHVLGRGSRRTAAIAMS